MLLFSPRPLRWRTVFMDLVLRPMSASQVLDRTFHLYRNHFVLFAGIAVLTPAMRLVSLLVQLKIFGPISVPPSPEGFTPEFFQALFLRVVVGFVSGTIVYVVGTAVASSATAYAVSMVHLGKTTSIAEAYSKVARIFWRMIGLLSSILLFTFGPLLFSYGISLGLAFAMT